MIFNTLKTAVNLCRTKFYINRFYILPRECISVFYMYLRKNGLIPGGAPFVAWVCGRSLVGIAGFDTAGGMDVRLM